MKRPTRNETADVAEGVHELQEETAAQKIADAKYEEECRKAADEYYSWLDRLNDFDDDFRDNDPINGRGSWDDDNLNEFYDDYDGF